MKVRGETVHLILDDAAEQVESPMIGSDVEDKGLELHCRSVKEGKGASVTVAAPERKAAVNSRLCGSDEASWSEANGARCGADGAN
ncbi:hypothetical protein E2C01_033469 [Portunus trituberculatus]|uniref:Uncharacterized protein n=1 Tax=Portunus trituberculatus TaxID=210409 RepID=A0A5B7F458_PORTR|nr:hypothetical protein [Portunus trituberculatus]